MVLVMYIFKRCAWANSVYYLSSLVSLMDVFVSTCAILGCKYKAWGGSFKKASHGDMMISLHYF